MASFIKKQAANSQTINLILICAISFLVPFMGSAITLALPKIGQQFSMNAVTLAWMATAYLMSTAIFQIPFAKLADIHGRKKMYCIGLFVFGITTIACGFAPTTEAMLLLRFAEGIGSSIIFGTGMAILVSLYPAQMRGKILGINTSVVYAALAAGPFIGGLMTDNWGWQSLFIITGIISLIICVMSMFFINSVESLKSEWKEDKQAFDKRGSVLFGITVFGVIYGFGNLQYSHGIICMLVGIIMCVIFVRYEKRQAAPVLNVNLLSKNKVLAMSTLAALINYASTAGLSFMLSLYLQFILGLKAKEAGLILISQALIQSFFSLISGRLSDKIAPSLLSTIGMVIIVFGITGLIFIDTETQIVYIIAMLVLLGIGFGIFSSPNTNVIMSSVEPANYGQVSATTGTARLIGQTFSLGIAGMIMSFYLGNNKITAEVFPELLNSIHTTFIIFLVLCLFGIYAATARIKHKNN